MGEDGAEECFDIGIIWEFFQLSGKIPDLIDRLKIEVSGDEMEYTVSLNIRAEVQSRPVEVLDGIWRRGFATSTLEHKRWEGYYSYIS